VLGRKRSGAEKVPTILKDRLELLDACKLRNKCCVEVGVLSGDFSAEILKREPFDLYLVDPWMKQDEMKYQDFNNQIRQQDGFDSLHAEVLKRFEKEIRHDSVHVLRMFSHQAIREINRQFDFVYIDAVHTYANVLHDLSAWSVKVKSGGIIAGHDYNSDFIGVTQAVEMFLDITRYELVYETTGEAWNSFAIRVK